MTAPITSSSQTTSISEPSATETESSTTTTTTTDSISKAEECCLTCLTHSGPFQSVLYFLWEKTLRLYSLFLSYESRMTLYSQAKIPSYFNDNLKKEAESLLASSFLADADQLTSLEGVQVPPALIGTEHEQECQNRINRREEI